MTGIDLQALGDTKLEALVEAMFLAAAADGDFSAVERAHFVKSVESLTDGRIAPAKLEALVSNATAALEREGREARLSSVKARLPDSGSRKVALSLIIQVTAADGIIRTSERELILETAEAANLVSKLGR
jgi:uncharacterized tellurite resistance protein B-like protein